MNKRHKIFLCEWGGPTLFGVARELKAKGCEILYWTGGKEISKEDFPGTIFHQNMEAALGKAALGVDTSSFEPVGRGVLEKLFECESTTLSMMDRMDFSNAPFHRRKRLYYNFVNYWNGVLKAMGPDAVVFYLSPNRAHYYILYSLAKLQGIKTVVCFPTSRALNSDRLLMVSDIKIGSDKLIRELRGVGNVRLEDLGEDIQDYYTARSGTGENFHFPSTTEDVLSNAVSKRFKLHKILLLCTSLMKGNITGKIKLRFHNIFFKRSRLATLGKNYTGLVYQKKLWEWRKLKKGFRKEYESLQTEVDWSKKFIFVALHLQPESSTSPDGGVFVDQHLMIKILAYSVPRDWVIYVKEHPGQLGVRPRSKGVRAQTHLARYKGYYREIASLRNVFLIPIHVMPDKLIEKCQAVATVTGTAGIEAVFKKKPALIFGYPPYRECSEICKVSDVQSCREAIEKIRNGYRPDKQRVLDYLGGLDRVGIRKWLDVRKEGKTFVELTDERREISIRDIADALYFEIQK